MFDRLVITLLELALLVIAVWWAWWSLQGFVHL